MEYDHSGPGCEGMARPTVPQAFFRAFNTVMRPLVRTGIASPKPMVPGAVVLETTGRTSGLKREVPLLAWSNGCRLFVTTIRRDSQWVKNLEADPDAAVWMNGRSWPAQSSLFRTPMGTVAELRLLPAA